MSFANVRGASASIAKIMTSSLLGLALALSSLLPAASLLAERASALDQTPAVTNVDAYYSSGAGYTGIGVDFTTNLVKTAKSVELIAHGGTSPYSISATSVLVNNLNDSVTDEYETSGTIVITGSRSSSSGSWETMAGSWAGSSRPTSVEVVVTLQDDTVLRKTDPTIVENGGNTEATVFATVPEITSVNAEYVQHTGPDYTGVYVGFEEKGVVDATDVELRLNREDGTHYSIHALTPVLGAVNASPALYPTGGTIIITGERTSGSWTPQTGNWTGTGRLATTDSVEVLITLGNGDVLSKTLALETDIRNQAIEDDVFPADAAGPVVSGVVLNGKNVNIARDVNCGPTDFNVVGGKVNLGANITDTSGVKSAKYKIRKVTAGGCTQAGIYTSNTVNMNNSGGDAWVTLSSSELDTAGVPDGTYTIQMTVTDNLGNAGTKYVDITVDNTAPPKPVIKTPTARQWFKTTPIETTWDAATDLSGIDHYQVGYYYDDVHTFGGSTCVGEVIGDLTLSGCRDTNSTSRNHSPADSEQGGVTVWVRAVDNAGNVGPWSKSVHYFYDHKAPTTTLNVSPVVDGKFTVSGDASDNLALNRVYVQLVSRVSNQRCGGTTINLIPEGANANWSRTYDIATLGCPEGNYAAHVSVTDMAGNSSSNGWTANFAVNVPEPVVAGTQFSTYSDGVWEGIYTEFDFTDFQTVTGVTVSLYDEDDNLITRNTHTQDLLDLIANHSLATISSPFVINDINYPVETFWNFNVDGYVWTDTSPKPAKVVFQVTGTDYFGDAATREDELVGLVESTWTFASILPEAIAPQSGAPQVQGASTDKKPNAKKANLVVTTLGNTQTLNSGDSDNSDENQNKDEQKSDDNKENENAEEVAGTNTDSDQNQGEAAATNGKNGFSWYWIIPVVGGLGFGTYYFAFARREQ